LRALARIWVGSAHQPVPGQAPTLPLLETRSPMSFPRRLTDSDTSAFQVNVFSVPETDRRLQTHRICRVKSEAAAPPSVPDCLEAFFPLRLPPGTPLTPISAQTMIAPMTVVEVVARCRQQACQSLRIFAAALPAFPGVCVPSRSCTSFNFPAGFAGTNRFKLPFMGRNPCAPDF